MSRPSLNTLQKYLSVANWLFRDLMSRFWRAFITILITRFVGMGFFVVAIGFVTYYARLLEEDRPVQFRDWSFQPRESVQLLILVGGSALIALGIGAALNWFANRRSMVMRRDYEVYCSRRVIELAGMSLRIWTPQDGPSMGAFLRMLARSDARYCGRVAGQLVRTVIPSLLVLVVALPALVYINPWLSLIVILLVVTSLSLHYRISVRAASESMNREKHQGSVAEMYKRLIETSVHQPTPQLPQNLDREFAHKPIRRYYDADVAYRLAATNSQFVSDVTLTLTITIVLVVLGGTILTHGTGWGALLVYLVALRYSMGRMRSLMADIANSNRFYHQIRRYFQFVANTTIAAPPDSADAVREVTMTVQSHDQIEGSLDSWTMTAGRRVAVITALPLNRYVLPEIIAGMTGREEDVLLAERVVASTAQVTRQSSLAPGQSLHEVFGLPDTVGLETRRPALSACGLWEYVERLLPPNAQQPLDCRLPENGQSLDEEACFVLLMLGAAERGYPLIAVEERALRQVRAPAREALLKHLETVMIVIVTDDPAAVEAYDVHMTAVLDGARLVGLGEPDWLRSQCDAVARVLAESSAAVAHTIRAGDDALDDEDM